jgi:hypothetical protein
MTTVPQEEKKQAVHCSLRHLSYFCTKPSWQNDRMANPNLHPLETIDAS